MFGMNGQSYGCVVQIYKSQPDWKASEPWMAANREIDDVTKQAYQFEKTAPDKAITLYRKAIKLIKAMDSNGKTAIAWRSSKYPINRLSLLLDKAGQKSEALNEIEDWIEYNDPVEISDADKETVMKRRSRLSKN